MCVISMVYDKYNKAWPWEVTPTITVPEVVETGIPWTGTGTTYPSVPEATALEAFERLCEAAKALDAILGLPDCHDPRKAEWLKEVKERVRQHEIQKIADRLDK